MRIFRTLHRFLAAERGSIPIEGLIGAAILAGWYMMAFEFYEAFRMKMVNQRAAYTLADLMSRREASIGPTYIEGTKEVIGYVAGQAAQDQSWVRISVIQCFAGEDPDMTPEEKNAPCDGVEKSAQLLGSYGTDGQKPLTQAMLETVADRIPIMAVADTAVITETSTFYLPVFANAGTFLGPLLGGKLRFSNFVVTRPRGVDNSWDSTS